MKASSKKNQKDNIPQKTNSVSNDVTSDIVEMPKEEKKRVAIIGFIVSLVIIILLIVFGAITVKSTGNIADVNTAGMALRSQLVEWEKINSPYPNHVEINVKNAYIKDCNTDINVGFLKQKTDDGEVDNFKKVYKQIYIEYEAKDFPTEGERIIAGDKFLCYICEDDLVLVVKHTDKEDKPVVVKKLESGEVDACAVTFRGSAINSTYFDFSNAISSLTSQYPTNFSGWSSINTNEVNDIINTNK